MRQLATLLAVLTLSTGSAFADNPTGCYDTIEGQQPVNTFLNKPMSDYWRQLLKYADANLMTQLAGIYYGERRSPDGLYLNQQYRQFDANGLFQYHDQTCTIGSSIPCSKNYGTGEWRAMTQQDGSLYMMTNFSDLSRSQACSGDRFTFDGTTIVDEAGTPWQRTQ